MLMLLQVLVLLLVMLLLALATCSLSFIWCHPTTTHHFTLCTHFNNDVNNLQRAINWKKNNTEQVHQTKVEIGDPRW